MNARPLLRHSEWRASERPLSQVDPSGFEPVTVAGKFLAAGDEPFYVRGVTYGPFAPGPDGCEYHTPAVVARDFEAMARHGFNTVRTYTPPPIWVLDLARSAGLRVFVGLPWEQHVAFLDTKRRRDDIVARVRAGVTSCARHPAVLGYAVGNEIPPPIARWYGRRPIERFIRRLYEAAKSEHPESLVTYVNFPTTEYLELPFLDFFAWNVYLETPERLSAYLARLQNLAAEKPLLLGEVGLDSQRNGEQLQAESLARQIQVAGSAGCAGAILFAWTDEWHRSGEEILDWRFGLTDRERRPKLALARAADAFDDFPLHGESHDWPSVSVVVCTYNGGRTLRRTLTALAALDYPRYEVIVVDDGSTDDSAAIAAASAARLISGPNRGLSHARNVGLRQAQGEIVAYLDDDAYPDHNWLRYLAHAFLTTDHAGIGGPNLCPPDAGEVAQCVSHSPGGPNHVLLSDTLAEHIPGCNMAFRRQALLDVGGFDERFRIAGDDVDLCWRLQDLGQTIGFHPTAMVWHQPRSLLSAYLRQQRNYGRAEAMLETKWPGKYNSAGHPRWSGRLYGRGRRESQLAGQSRVQYGVWGSNLFQSLYTRQAGVIGSLPLVPEWYLLLALLGVLSLSGLLWRPLLWAIPLLIAAAAPLLGLAVGASIRAQLPWIPGGRWRSWKQRARIAGFHLLQPAVRLQGRLGHGLHPLRYNRVGFAVPRPRAREQWSESWRSPEQRLKALEKRVLGLGAGVRRGFEWDRWDLEVTGGLAGRARILLAVEEHGQGKQLARIACRPRVPGWFAASFSILAVFALLAAASGAPAAALVFAAGAALLVGKAEVDCAAACGVCREAIEAPEPQMAAAHPASRT